MDDHYERWSRRRFLGGLTFAATAGLLGAEHGDAAALPPPETPRLRPWSQYFCCMLVGNGEFVRKHPVATKRAVRAILKADQICALEPEHVARSMVDRGFTKNYDYALQAMKDIPYGRWRQYDPEDAVRFYALRLHESGVIGSTPQRIIAEHTNWQFLNELKKELKG